ncbi:hypothetical protein D3C75_1221310 [compost metagenome]
MNSTSIVTGLVTPRRVSSPCTTASFGSLGSIMMWTERKVATGWLALSKKSAVCRWRFNPSSFGATSVRGMLAVRVEADGLAGSSVNSAETLTN